MSWIFYLILQNPSRKLELVYTITQQAEDIPYLISFLNLLKVFIISTSLISSLVLRTLPSRE